MGKGIEHTDGDTFVNPVTLQRIRKSVDDLLAAPFPLQAFTRLAAKSQSPNSAPFERYAGAAFKACDLDVFSEFGVNHAVKITPAGSGRLARLRCNADLEPRGEALLQTIEDVVNRLIGIADALEDNVELNSLQRGEVVSASIIGGAFRSSMPARRSMHVHLPALGKAEQPGIEFLNEVDWRSLDHVASMCKTVFQSSILPNMHQSFMGAYAPMGSDWDVRTRLASILERLEYPLHTPLSFDCDIPGRTAAIRFRIPGPKSFPHLHRGPDGALHEIDGQIMKARETYAYRFSCLLAAACFGAGRNIEQAHIEAVDPLGPGFSIGFNRHDFVHITLVAVEDRSLSDPAIRFDPDKALRIASPAYSGNAGSRFDVSDARKPCHEDKRPLPDNLERLFHARRICDIGTSYAHGDETESIEIARLDSNDSILAAIATLEDVERRIESTLAPPDDDGAALPLYCSNPLSRATVSLLDDDFAVSLQAQSFIDGYEQLDFSPDRLPHFFRAPYALFQAHVGLSDLYARLGDLSAAHREADEAIKLAPTTAQAYYQKANVLAQQDRFTEAANTLMAGLRCAVSERDCALLYYHLGLILWKIGRKRDAAAVYVYTMSLAGEYAEKAAEVVRKLRKREGMPVITFASPFAAAREMTRFRIPVAPSDEARTLVVHAAVGLSCANALSACTPYASALARYFRNDPVIVATVRSIIEGLKKPD